MDGQDFVEAGVKLQGTNNVTKLKQFASMLCTVSFVQLHRIYVDWYVVVDTLPVYLIWLRKCQEYAHVNAYYEKLDERTRIVENRPKDFIDGCS